MLGILQFIIEKCNFQQQTKDLYALLSYSFSFDPSLWQSLLLSTAAIKGFPHHI